MRINVFDPNFPGTQTIVLDAGPELVINSMTEADAVLDIGTPFSREGQTYEQNRRAFLITDWNDFSHNIHTAVGALRECYGLGVFGVPIPSLRRPIYEEFAISSAELEPEQRLAFIARLAEKLVPRIRALPATISGGHAIASHSKAVAHPDRSVT